MHPLTTHPIASAAPGATVATAKAQIAYHALRGEAPNIPFLAAPVVSIAGEGPKLTIAVEQKKR